MNEQSTIVLTGLEIKALKLVAEACDDEDHPIHSLICLRGSFADATNRHILIRHRLPARDFEGAWLIDPAALEKWPELNLDNTYEISVRADDGSYPKFTDKVIIDEEGRKAYRTIIIPPEALKVLRQAYKEARAEGGYKVHIPIILSRGGLSNWNPQEPLMKCKLDMGDDELGLNVPYLGQAFRLAGTDEGLSLSFKEGDTLAPVIVNGPFEAYMIMPMRV